MTHPSFLRQPVSSTPLFKSSSNPPPTPRAQTRTTNFFHSCVPSHKSIKVPAPTTISSQNSFIGCLVTHPGHPHINEHPHNAGQRLLLEKPKHAKKLGAFHIRSALPRRFPRRGPMSPHDHHQTPLHKHACPPIVALSPSALQNSIPNS